jgi:hypothetical protein
MNTIALDSRIFEFETEEHASSYDQWFKSKVQEALNDQRAGVPHDQLMAEIDALIGRSCFAIG